MISEKIYSQIKMHTTFLNFIFFRFILVYIEYIHKTPNILHRRIHYIMFSHPNCCEKLMLFILQQNARPRKYIIETNESSLSNFIHKQPYCYRSWFQTEKKHSPVYTNTHNSFSRYLNRPNSWCSLGRQRSKKRTRVDSSV